MNFKCIYLIYSSQLVGSPRHMTLSQALPAVPCPHGHHLKGHPARTWPHSLLLDQRVHCTSITVWNGSKWQQEILVSLALGEPYIQYPIYYNYKQLLHVNTKCGVWVAGSNTWHLFFIFGAHFPCTLQASPGGNWGQGDSFSASLRNGYHLTEDFFSSAWSIGRLSWWDWPRSPSPLVSWTNFLKWHHSYLAQEAPPKLHLIHFWVLLESGLIGDHQDSI